MKNETKNCKNCKKGFEITSEDFNFYEKIKVLPTTWCPECRQLRRYAWRNERTLYRRNCDLCKKSTVTIYSPNKPYKVYCNECWWGDGWDASSYGRDFDFNRPFFEQFSELQHDVPRMALLNKRSVNSEYTNHSGDNKDVYLTFSSFFDENVMYSTWVFYSKDCLDCSFIHQKGERSYEVVDSRTSYRCQFGFFLKDCSDCLYCYDCRGCTNCFMSSNLRNRSYVFRNQQYSREEYFNKIKEHELSSFSTREKLQKEFMDLLENQSAHRYVMGEQNVNSSGSLMYHCRNSSASFELEKSENCKYIYSALDAKDCFDLYHVGFQTEQCYELQGCTRVSNCQFCHLCYDNMNVMYSDSCQNSQNLFGCVSIKKGEYMIFNKKYSKEEYLKLKDKIIEHMKKTGEFGEFFPPEIAPVYYNETQGNLYAPMSKEEVLAKGWHWEDNIPGTTGKETIKNGDIPDKIKDVPDTYLKEIFSCMVCAKNYNITQNELLFLRKEGIPFPRKCPNCRYKRRFDLRPPRRLWVGKCKCGSTGSPSTTTIHDHQGPCPNEFKTTYAPERPEKVYCESCYNKEVY